MLPKALPDESFFGRVSRGLVLSGLTEAQYIQTVFGNGRGRVHPFLAANMGCIALLTSESSKDIILYQTLSPLFAYFLPKHRELLYSADASLQQVTRACQFSAVKEFDKVSVKSCSLCRCEDINEYGVNYYHCAHQIPGVDACYKHGVWLDHHILSGRSHLSVKHATTSPNGITPCSKVAVEFAKYAYSFLSRIRDHPQSSVGSYRQLLNESGFLSSGGYIRQKALVSALTDMCERIFPKDSSLIPTQSKESKYWSPLLYDSVGPNPFKHLALMFMLSRSNEGDNSVHPSKSTLNECLETQCVQLLQQGFSLSEVGRRICKSRCYVKGIAIRYGIDTHLKPQKLTQAVIRKIQKLAYKGVHRKAISESLELSTGTVEMVISATEGLVEWRKRCRCESKKRRYKCEILRFIEDHPNAIRQDIKRNREAAFFWLYAHEREWLNANLPLACKPIKPDRVDWEERDAELNRKVHELLLRNKITSRTELDGMLGSHGWLISKKDKLPRTMSLLKAFGFT